MEFTFSGAIWHWRGPSPFYFITVPEDESDLIKEESNSITYGWGMIPVSARIGRTTFTTSLFAKDGGYVLPLKAVVRTAEGLGEGDVATVVMTITIH